MAVKAHKAFFELPFFYNYAFYWSFTNPKDPQNYKLFKKENWHFLEK